MKTISLLLILGSVVLGDSLAVARPAIAFIGKPVVDITATSQDLSYQQVSAKTNLVRGATNDTTVLKSTTTNSTINATSLLGLLANSFNTNFPEGTQLLLTGNPGGYSFAVSDSTGTNVSTLPVSTVLIEYVVSEINSSRQTELITNEVLSAGNLTQSFTATVAIQYRDNAMTTGDGTHTSFVWNGLAEIKASTGLATGAATENVTINVTGGGEIRGQPRNIFTGSIRAKLTRLEPVG